MAVHLGLLLLASRPVAPRVGPRRTVVGLVVLAAILGHLLEITLFAGGYALIAPADGGRFDVWYHSASAYTSLGDSQLGDAGWRLMTAVEALAGLVLITWTASFTFLVMQRNWEQQEAVRSSPPPGGAGVRAVKAVAPNQFVEEHPCPRS